MAKLRAEIDSDGRIVLPDDLKRRLGLRPGDSIVIDEASETLLLHPSATSLRKIYIEPTNACNLECRTCMRNDWGESPGFMDRQTFSWIIDGLSTFSPPPSIFFGGYGEPLFHTDIVQMVAAAKATGAIVELITNGTLLTKAISKQLVEAGLDRLWVSLDGAKPESYADIRLGALFPEVIDNIMAFRSTCRLDSSLFLYPERPSLGVVFVAMRRNIVDLPDILQLSSRLGAQEVLVTNVLPYTFEMSREVLYSRTIRNSPVSAARFRLQLPRVDLQNMPYLLADNLAEHYTISWNGNSTGPATSCPFVSKGSMSINWEGNVSPCLPLMYDHAHFFDGQRRYSQSHHINNVSQAALTEIWNKTDYVAFREKVLAFDFPSCMVCGGCYLWEENGDDCYGNTHPTCGGCLWAQGVVRCP